MNAVGGADIDTEGIFDTRIGDYVSHDEVSEDKYLVMSVREIEISCRAGAGL
jgi:hypothetical protein